MKKRKDKDYKKLNHKIGFVIVIVGGISILIEILLYMCNSLDIWGDSWIYILCSVIFLLCNVISLLCNVILGFSGMFYIFKYIYDMVSYKKIKKESENHQMKIKMRTENNPKENENHQMKTEMRTENNPKENENHQMKIKMKTENNPIKIENSNIYFNSDKFYRLQQICKSQEIVNITDTIKITNKEPVISVYEDNVKTVEYCLQTEKTEDFTGKYFHITVRIDLIRGTSIPVILIDGFISDEMDKDSMSYTDIGYRMEALILRCGGKEAEKFYNNIKTSDLVEKGLKNPGFTTPANVRLIGICPECHKSFTFHGYAFYMAQSDVAYSDNGLECCEITNPSINHETWTCEKNNIVFRYYNSFCCPHCGKPYIDYNNNHNIKRYGVSGCVHLGHTHYKDI